MIRMNIFFYELKAYRKSILIWSLSMAALAVMYILIYNNLGKDIEAFQNILKSLPEIVRKSLNMYVEGISNLVGFYSMIYVYVVLCGAIQAMNLGVSILSKEIRDKTADFLLTKPVSRKNVMTAKILSAVTSLMITNIIYLSIVMLSTLSVKSDFDMVKLLMISVTILFVQLMFLAMGIIASVIIGKIKSVVSISLSTVFVFFIINMFGSVIGEDKVRYITPFKYFDPQYIIKNSSYESQFIVVGLLFVIVSIFASYFVYLKKDIHAV